MTTPWSYGYTNVRSLKGGFGEWVAAGLPGVNVPEPEVAFDMDAAFNTFLADMEGHNTVGLEDLNLMLAEDPPPFVLDVRELSEVEENGHIEGAVNIPLREVANHVEWLPSFDTTIVSYCGSGHRSTIGMSILWSYGYTDVLSLKGGFAAWTEAGYPVGEFVTQ